MVSVLLKIERSDSVGFSRIFQDGECRGLTFGAWMLELGAFPVALNWLWIGFQWLPFGFGLGLNWLYLGSFGFVFHRENHCFDPVKSGDSGDFKLALFRNFMFLKIPVVRREGTHRQPRDRSGFFILHSSFLISIFTPPSCHGRLDKGCPTLKIPHAFIWCRFARPAARQPAAGVGDCPRRFSDPPRVFRAGYGRWP